MKEKIFTWLYRIFTFLVPSGIALYTFLLEKLLDNDISVMAKVGVSGIFVLIIMVVIAVFFFGKFLKKKISKITDEIIVCLDNEEKQKLIKKKAKWEGVREMFHNALFLAPFLIIYFLIVLIEKEMIEMRGTMFFVVISMAIGFGFNGVKQFLCKNANTKEKEIVEKIDKGE